MTRRTVLTVAVALLIFAAGTVHAAPETFAEMESSIYWLWVETQDAFQPQCTAGVIAPDSELRKALDLDKGGSYVLTAAHCIIGAHQQTGAMPELSMSREDRAHYSLELVWIGYKHEGDGNYNLREGVDAAVLRSTTNIPGLELSQAGERPSIGANLHAMAYRFDSLFYGIRGYVASPRLPLSRFGGLQQHYILADMWTYPGASGGPVVDDSGRVVGIIMGSTVVADPRMPANLPSAVKQLVIILPTTLILERMGVKPPDPHIP